ncbi:MAG: VWA-like domain-containing protein [Blautia sp.]|jgi:predicted metal-dependent peptidase
MNPIREEQLREEKQIQICQEILKDARNELYLNMRFMDVALSSLRFIPDEEICFVGTDGQMLFYRIERLIEAYKKGKVLVNRAYLHSIFHCLFCHWFPDGDKREEEYWNLACDVAVEWMIDGLSLHCLHLMKTPFRRKAFSWIAGQKGTVTAQRLYGRLLDLHLNEEQLGEWMREFTVDDHRHWKRDGKSGPHSQSQKDHWEDIRNKMQTELETFSKEAAKDCEVLSEQLRAANRQRYDYREFLRKFSVYREEMQVDMDTFDYIFYHYGMEVYGNMPLIEPLETKEVQKIQDFVIVIDTSMSCKAELVQKFLQETYAILRESESFFQKIHVHILQCDEAVRSDVRITEQKELKEYMEHFTLVGQGGTDFRPPFAYVEELKARGEFAKLRGLIYFTDGYGIFPAKKPDYDTAFVFMEEDYQDVDVPPWAIKLILEPEDITGV